MRIEEIQKKVSELTQIVDSITKKKPKAVKPKVIYISKPNSELLTNIVGIVSEHFNVPVADIIGKSRATAIKDARFYYYYISRMNRIPFAAIGSFCGGRDHSTVMSGLQKMDDCISVYKNGNEQKTIDLLMSLVKGSKAFNDSNIPQL